MWIPVHLLQRGQPLSGLGLNQNKVNKIHGHFHFLSIRDNVSDHMEYLLLVTQVRCKKKYFPIL